MKTMYKRGFTLIELLVVIAIIGILASVVLASLNNARDKGSDSSVKSNLSGVRAAAAVAYDNVGDYTAICSDATVLQQVNAAIVASGIANQTLAVDQPGAADTATCNQSIDSYVIEVPLKSIPTSYFCVDSSGLSQENTATALGAADDYSCS